MKRLLFGLCLALTLGVCLLVGAGVSEAAQAKVSYEVDNVVLDHDYVVLQGHFQNHTDYYQRVTGIDLSYTIRGGASGDMDDQAQGYPLLTGAYADDDLKIDIGGDPVPYTIRIQDSHASEFTTADVFGWRVRANLELE